MIDRTGKVSGAGPLVAAALCLVAGAAIAQDNQTFEFKGASSSTTSTFDVQAPWVLDWRVYSDFPQAMSVDIALLDAVTGLHQGQILQTKEVGDGVKLFNQSGSFKLRVDSDLARWHLIIAEVTKEEAERYTPIGEGAQQEQGPFRQRR
jgi:hypothetical protein